MKALAIVHTPIALISIADVLPLLFEIVAAVGLAAGASAIAFGDYRPPDSASDFTDEAPNDCWAMRVLRAKRARSAGDPGSGATHVTQKKLVGATRFELATPCTPC
jgi:hypothetical protein